MFCSFLTTSTTTFLLSWSVIQQMAWLFAAGYHVPVCASVVCSIALTVGLQYNTHLYSAQGRMPIGGGAA